VTLEEKEGYKCRKIPPPPPLAEILAVFLGEGANMKKGQKKGPKCEKRKKEERLNINRKCKGKIIAKLRHSYV
jgi:hypothetical protein